MNGATYTLPIDTGLALYEPMQLCQDAAGTPVNLTGCSFEAHVLASTHVAPLTALTVTILDAARGQILISATAEVTAALGAQGAALAWNLLITDTIQPKRVLVRGPVELSGVIQ